MVGLIFRYFLSRLKEKSTWLTIILAIAGAFGIKLAPEQQNAIMAAISAILAAVLAFAREKED